MMHWFCRHNWKMLDVLERVSTTTGNVMGKIFVQKCTKCGKLRHYELKI